MLRRMIAGLVAGACLLAAEAQTPAKDLTQAELDQLGVALARGKEIYLNDQAAWHVSDAMVLANPGEKARPVVGWITERVDDDHVAAIFVRRDGETVREFFRGVTRGSDLVSSLNLADDMAAPVLTSQLMGRFSAYKVAWDQLGGSLCGRRPNFVVLPAEAAQGGWDVYAIVPEQVAGEVAMAGHVRFTIGPDGELINRHEYSSSCLVGQRSKEAVMMVVTVPRERGMLPNEMHVFGALSHGIPFYVVTSDRRIWVVDGERVMLSDRLVDPPASDHTP
jgi:hypothetical protein